jgi:VWFA-related protein
MLSSSREATREAMRPVVRAGEGVMQKRLALVTLVAVWAAATAATGPLAATGRQGGTPAGATQEQTAPDSPRPQGETPAGQQTGQAPGQPVFRAGINFVRVDVIATDNKGNAVLDLKPEDLIVSEDGKPQVIESFKLIKVDERNETTPPREIRTTYDEESEAQREDVRLFAIFLDDYHVRRGASMYARQPLMRFLQNQVAPSDMVAMMYPLTPLSDVVMSRNHEALARAIEKFDGRKFDYTPRNLFEEKYANYPATVVERMRNEVSLSALRALVTHMGSLREGRKAVILVSEGYSNYLPPQLRDPIASMPGLGNPARGAPMAGVGEDRERFFSNAEMMSDLKEVYSIANRNNTAIYALDPRGLAPFEFDINEGVGDSRVDQASLRMTQDSLRILADETDGRAIVNQNDLDKGLRQILSDSSVYYLVGYNSSQAPQDGKFHEIKVRVKRSGVQLRHRKGYWALTAEETARALAPPAPAPPKDFEVALASITPRPAAQASSIRTWIGTSRGDNGRTRVTFVWEPAPPPPGVRREEAARVMVTALAPDGSAYFRGRVPDVALASTAPPQTVGTAAAPARGPAQVVFDAAPGPMQLRFSIENANAGVIDTDVREVTVPDLTVPQVQLSTPRVLRARTVKEFRELNADPHAVASASREFRRTDRLVIRFDAYAPAGTPAVTARLLNRGGTAMADIPVSTQAAGATHQIDLPLANIAPAEYLIEVTAKGEGGEERQFVAFRLVS